MYDYIRRKDALGIIKRTSGDYMTAYAETRRLPAAEVAEVRHGHWVYRHRHRGGIRTYTGIDSTGEKHTITVDERFEIDDPYCSVCGKFNESSWLSFCPNCGVMMDEPKEFVVEGKG